MGHYYGDLVYRNRCYLSSDRDTICLNIFVIHFGQLESSKSRKSQLIYHRGDCLAEMDFYGPRALYSLQLAWIDGLLLNEHELIRDIPSMCLQRASLNRPEYACKYTLDWCCQPLPPPNPVWSLGNHCTLFQPGLQVQIMLCVSKHSLFSIRNVNEISGIWN